MSAGTTRSCHSDYKIPKSTYLRLFSVSGLPALEGEAATILVAGLVSSNVKNLNPQLVS